KWIRTDIGDYDNPGFDDLTMSLAFLPDLKTESKIPSGLPNFYQHKPDTNAKVMTNFTPRDYLTHWLSQWVRDYGIDGFRVDTAKHVEPEAWLQLKNQASQALAAWKAANPDKKLDDA
ncbi:alpha-amylase, partial [Enterobacter hormaechei subsp. xiangfangensis]